MAHTFDLFGTLVRAATPDDPARAVAKELAARDVAVPDDWARAYGEVHIDAPEGAEVPLPAHVAAALRDRGVDVPANAARRAVVAAFDPDVETVEGARAAVAAAAERGPVAVCSNCSVPELAARTLIRADLERDAFDAVVTSVACGWRKPDTRLFEATARTLGVAPDSLTHVGDDPRTDGGVEAVGGRFVDVADVPLATFPDWLEGR
ncbi:HAD family hydrolase [Halomarina ordinaria]|uniref:HAD family hydrolase n=1 Tax=Halomarina ordinaria TaxID=3033939 RepID=A0ABD5U8C1_9EURY|nr:HAD family hydrolase [Halomarina sp. PSRA2]